MENDYDFTKFSCGGFFIFDPTEQFVLFGETPQGHLSPQKGGVETKIDHSLFECACRETKEESGILANELVFSSTLFIENAPSGRPNIAYWMAKLKTMKRVFTFDTSELKSVRWFHIDTFLTLKSPKLKTQRLEILQTMQKNLGDTAKTTWFDFDTFPQASKCVIFHTAHLQPAPPILNLSPPITNLFENESRLVVQLLRHQLKDLNPDAEGYVKVTCLLEAIKNDIKNMPTKKSKKFKQVTFDMLREIVSYDTKYSKQRMDIKLNSKNEWVIAANQGHSGDVVIKLEEIKTPLPYLIHGTEKRFREPIERLGLLKMTRTHIHCIACDPNLISTTEIISGFKKQSNLIVIVDMKQTMLDGIKWYTAKNGVILTEGPIPPKYLTFQNLPSQA